MDAFTHCITRGRGHGAYDVCRTPRPSIHPRALHSWRATARMVSRRSRHSTALPCANDSPRSTAYPRNRTTSVVTQLNAIHAGEPEAFGLLWEQLQPFLRRYTMQVDFTDRPDLQQTLAFTLWRALKEHAPQILTKLRIQERKRSGHETRRTSVT